MALAGNEISYLSVSQRNPSEAVSQRQRHPWHSIKNSKLIIKNIF